MVMWVSSIDFSSFRNTTHITERGKYPEEYDHCTRLDVRNKGRQIEWFSKECLLTENLSVAKIKTHDLPWMCVES